MSWIRSLALTSGLLSLASCSGKTTVLDSIKASSERLCACKDASCLQREAEIFEGFTPQLDTLGDEELEQAVQVMEKGFKCSLALAAELGSGS